MIMSFSTPEQKQPSQKRFTPYNNRRKSSSGCFAPFKSPGAKATSNSKESDSDTNKIELAREVLALHKQIEEKDREIKELSENYSINELQQHIDMLHEYNEIKDVAQMVIGKLAEHRGTTTKELYPEFNLELDD